MTGSDGLVMGTLIEGRSRGTTTESGSVRVGQSRVNKPGRPDPSLSGVRRIESEAEAVQLAHWILTPGRSLPVVVLTIPGGHDTPFGNPIEIKEAVGDLADVVLMPTSGISWTFSREMPPMTQVYGGAGRVYPVDHEWVSRPDRSRLRFAYSARDRARITEQLINDALEAALAAGLVEPRTSPRMQQRTGQVKGIIGSRALVTFADGSVATVWEELTIPGVGLDRVLTRGQSVEGGYDPYSRRLDLRGSLRYTDPAAALAALTDTYRVGDVVLAEVVTVTDDVVQVRPLPGLMVEVPREAVTTNPNDRLAGLFSAGEVILCRVAGIDPVRLRCDDIDDEEAPRDAPSLLPDGPPWLRPGEPEPEPLAPAPVPAPVPSPPALPRQPIVREEARRVPSPLDLARRVGSVPLVGGCERDPGTGGPAASPSDIGRTANGSGADRPGGLADGPPGATASGGPSITVARQLMEVTNELAAEQATRRALAAELAALRDRAAQLEDENTRLTHDYKQWRTRYRDADRAKQAAQKKLKGLPVQPESTEVHFLDPAEQFRWEVTCEWVNRIPAAEKAERPLAPYTLADGFLASLDQLAGVSRPKVVAVVVEVLTGQVQHIAGRDLHQLRTGGAGSPYVRRAGDGATCWRVALQREAAAARRLHYWHTRDGYEFSRVVVHDDYRP